MKRSAFALALLALSAFVASPLLASPFDGKDGKKKEPPKKEAPKKKEEPKPKPEEKKPAPKALAIGAELSASTSLMDSSGKAQTLKDYRGKIVVLEFWSVGSATGSQAKRLAKVAQDFSAKGVVVLGVDALSTEAGDAKTVQEAVTKNAVTFPVLLDKGGVLAEQVGAKALDQVFVLDAKGILRYSGAIDDDPKGEKADKAQDYLSAALRAVADGKDVTPPTTTPNGAPLHLETKKAAAGAVAGGGKI